MTAESTDLLVGRGEDGIVLVTLNRPRSKNTVSFAMWEAFGELLTEIETGSPPRALVICGADNWFSSGGDVKNPPARGEGALKLAARLELGQRAIRRLSALPVPTIAAVEGGAWGVSWGLALACDVLIVGASASFGAPFLKFGLTPDGGVAWYLTREVGRRIASEIIYSGRTVPVDEAARLGLVSRIVPDGTVVAEALAFARAMGDGNRQATELTKRLIHASETASLENAHALELVYCHQLQSGEEALRAREVFAARSAAKKG